MCMYEYEYEHGLLKVNGIQLPRLSAYKYKTITAIYALLNVDSVNFFFDKTDSFSFCINTIFKIAITWIDFEAMAS